MEADEYKARASVTRAWKVRIVRVERTQEAAIHRITHFLAAATVFYRGENHVIFTQVRVSP